MQISSRRTRSGAGLVIELARPRNLNALDLAAFLEIRRLLDEAADDPAVRFVTLVAPTHENPRAFCAGGDVRWLYDEFRRSRSLQHGQRFFETEYGVDRAVWEFPKPILALTHGITMGGGIGLIRGASHRVACETSVWAMPEVSIGLFPDVGATYFLSLLPRTWAAFLALTGARVGIRDIMDLRLATHSCRQADLPTILDEVERLAPAKSAAASGALQKVLAAHLVPARSRSWQRDRLLITRVFSRLRLDRSEQDRTAERLWNEAERATRDRECSDELRAALETLLAGSPLSLRLILEQLRLGRLWRKLGRNELKVVFDWEYQAAMNCMAHGDFFEGVRSRLVDKDFREPGRPSWKHRSPAEVEPATLNLLFPPELPR